MQAFDTHRLTQSAGRPDALRSRMWLWARFVGAVALLAVGAVHLQQYVELYSTILTIGILFVLNFLGATAIGLGLLAPIERLLGRWGGRALGPRSRVSPKPTSRTYARPSSIEPKVRPSKRSGVCTA